MIPTHAPKVVSIIKRRIRDDATYDDFREAWLPEVEGQYEVPTYVVNAENVSDPSEIISIGLVFADLEEVIQEAARTQKQDEGRRDKVAEVTQPIEGATLYRVKDFDKLSCD